MSGFIDAVAGAPSNDFWVLFSIAGVFCLAAFAGGFVYLYRARVIEDTPTARLRSASQGYAEFEGVMTMLPGEPVICPLSASRCCWWRYTVEEKQTRYSNGKRHTRWVTVDQDTSDAMFRLEDDTGECVIDPLGATVIPSRKQRWYGATRRPTGSPASGSGWLRAAFSRYRYVEELLLVGRPLYAIGLFRTHGDGGQAPDLSGDVRDLLLKWKHDPKMRAMLDVNKDGELDAREWEATTRLAEKRIESEQQPAEAMPDTNLLSKAPGRRPFLLSALTQDQLITRYRRRGWVAIVGFLVILALLLVALEARGLL